MDDFDTVLELQLRRMLDPVVASRPPARGHRPKRTRKPILRLHVATIDGAVVAVPVAGTPQL